MSHVAIAPSVLIRAARGSDGAALARLAELDSSRVPAGELLVAEAEGAIVAARAPDGAVIADPFRPTADVVDLLSLRARTLTGARPRRGLLLRPRTVVSRTA